MQNCVDYLPRKSFNTYGVVLLTLYGLFAVVAISISGSLAFDSSFNCYHRSIPKTKDLPPTKSINIKCSLEYQEKFHFALPMYAMFFLNFGVVFCLSIIYGYLVKHRVQKFDYPTGTSPFSNEDAENQVIVSASARQNQVRECLGHFSTFFIYIAHLIVARILPLAAFALMFHTAHIPDKFPCPWLPGAQQKGVESFNFTINTQLNMTIFDCTNPVGRKTKSLLDAVTVVNIVVVVITMLELGYIMWLAFSDRSFMRDHEFCTVYLLRKRKRFRKFVTKIRDRFNPDNIDIFQLKDNFGEVDVSLRPLEDIYVNVVIQEGREPLNAYPSEFERHEIFQSHLRTSNTVTKLTSPTDIFKPKADRQSQAYPRTILVIGRPGIGKTMLTKKLLHQWKGNEDMFWLDKIVLLLKFRAFTKKPITLREMLGYGEGLSSDDFETVYKSILLNPTKTVLIFDGLDEMDVDRNLVYTETVGNHNKKMPVFSIFKLIVEGRLLRGATVLTTSRPTAKYDFQELNFQRKVEILGFFEDQIKEYVYKFCNNDNELADLIWNQIKGSNELLSLCYVPVNSYIICLTLKESIEDVENNTKLHKSLHKNVPLPKTVTQVYKRAVKVLLYRHHPAFKLQARPSDYLLTPVPKELENDLMKLKKIALDGVEDDKLIFDQRETDGLGDLSNCGLFHKLPDKEQNLFCFLHLTLQEFFAALKLVDDLKKAEQYLTNLFNEPKWQFVIQFVAGLIGDKIREARVANEKGVWSDAQWRENQKILVNIQKRYKY